MIRVFLENFLRIISVLKGSVFVPTVSGCITATFSTHFFFSVPFSTSVYLLIVGDKVIAALDTLSGTHTHSVGLLWRRDRLVAETST